MNKRPNGAEAERPGDGGGGGSANVAEELAGLRRSMDQLIQGVMQLAETTGTHTEMLRALLNAVAAPTEPEDNLARLLQQIVRGLDEQSVLLSTIGAAMTSLPEDVGKAVGGQMAAALVGIR